MNQPYVLSFVGQNANGILRWWTEAILAGFEKQGYGHRLVDLMDPAWGTKLGEIMKAGHPEFCFSFQGLGMDIGTNGENVWTGAGIPFFTYMGDSPYHAPRMHAAHAPGMYLLYGCGDFLDTYQRFMNGGAYATLVPAAGFPASLHADRKPWKQRSHEIVFAKTAVNPAAMRDSWKKLPSRMHALVEESADLVLSGTDDTVAACCARVFSDRCIHWGDVRELFLAVCSKVDFYVRAVRAERMVRALMRHNALIIGDWSHLDQSNSRARFIRQVEAAKLDELYADSRILANTLPGVRMGNHERVTAGLFSKCAVISESTPWLDRCMERYSSFYGLNIDSFSFDDDLEARLHSILNDPEIEEKIETSAALARDVYSIDNFVTYVLSHLEMEKYRKDALGWWCFPPSK